MQFLLPEPLRWLLAPLAALYGGLVEIRNAYFDAGYLPRHRLPVPVISVGNLSVGGAGKTPVTAFLAGYLERQGLRVAVLTQGYGRRSSGLVVLTPRNFWRIPPEKSGDEPRILASRMERGCVLVHRNRIAAAEEALKDPALRPDLFLLDDGFQHRQLARDLDILVVDAATLGQPQQVLPVGWLREPLRRAGRAHLHWFTRANQYPITEREIAAWQRRAGGERPYVVSGHEPCVVRRATDWRAFSPDWLAGKRVVGFCAVANPHSFKKTLMELGAEIADFRAYRDHHVFTPRDWKFLRNKLEEKDADFLIATEKDVVRQAIPEELGDTVFFVELEVQIYRGMDVLSRRLAAFV